MSPQLAPTFIGPVNVRSLTGAEFSQWTVQRDTAMYAHGEYAQNALRRAARIIEQQAASMPEGYRRHWNLVDAQMLRNMAGVQA